MNITQSQSSVSVYFTKLKTIWEELSNYRPICTCGKCNCGGTKKLTDPYHMEYVMSFLMGLNDSFAQVPGQLLMMDPLPSVNKGFTLISQEEQQRSFNANINAAGNTDSMAFQVKNDAKRSNKIQRRERPVCTYGGYTGHEVDKCYKIARLPTWIQNKVEINL